MRFGTSLVMCRWCGLVWFDVDAHEMENKGRRRERRKAIKWQERDHKREIKRVLMSYNFFSATRMWCDMLPYKLKREWNGGMPSGDRFISPTELLAEVNLNAKKYQLSFFPTKTITLSTFHNIISTSIYMFARSLELRDDKSREQTKTKAERNRRK